MDSAERDRLEKNGLRRGVVKRIEAHADSLTFESEDAKGTTFIVTLPQTAE